MHEKALIKLARDEVVGPIRVIALAGLVVAHALIRIAQAIEQRP